MPKIGAFPAAAIPFAAHLRSVFREPESQVVAVPGYFRNWCLLLSHDEKSGRPCRAQIQAEAKGQEFAFVQFQRAVPDGALRHPALAPAKRSEEHTSELQSQ